MKLLLLDFYLLTNSGSGSTKIPFSSFPFYICMRYKIQRYEDAHTRTFTVRYPFSIINYPLSIINYPLHIIHYTLYITHYWLSTIHYPLSIIHYSLFIIHYPLTYIHYPLCIIHYLLSTFQDLLSINHYPWHIIQFPPIISLAMHLGLGTSMDLYTLTKQR